jgi:hypothetical protein
VRARLQLRVKQNGRFGTDDEGALLSPKLKKKKKKRVKDISDVQRRDPEHRIVSDSVRFLTHDLRMYI